MRKVIWLQTHTVCWQDEKKILSAIELHGVNDGRQTEIHTAQPLVSEPSVCEIEMAVEKLKESDHQVLIQSLQNSRG